ncbi:MAG TPA: ATP-binding protein [Candidatus Bathyarchaeia archaeon]|nr:ATP-binding protein [Candidatus Bathyarchaeia archaeon]
MRLGVRSREALVVSLLTLLVVTTATAIHVSQLSRVVVQEAVKQTELIAKQIYAQSSRAIQRAPNADPLDALREDPDLRGFLESSVGYSPNLLYALIADRIGVVLLHTEREKEGKPEPERPNLEGLLKVDTLSRFSALYTSSRTYETVLPMTLNDRLFASIRLGVSTTLLRREVTASLQQSLAVAAVALPLAWLAAMVLAQLTVRPIRAIVGQVDRLRRGEPIDTTPVGGDEFQELSAQLSRLGRELQADRLSTLSEKAHLQGVVDQLEDGVIFLNPERHVLFFNRAAEAVVGQSLEQTVGLPIQDVLDPAHPLLAFVDQVLAGGAGVRNATVALPQGGREKEFLVSAFHMEDARRVMGVAVLLKDLESIKTVQSLVSYSAKLAALGRLTSGVAHEVKNPLNAMMIHVELLKERLEDASPDVRQSLEVIGSEIRRLDRVVQGFLKFMRPQELTLKPVDLNGLLQSLGALLEAESQSHGVRFVFDLDGGLPVVSADEELLRQAFINILQNAVQAMPQGGAVRIRTRSDGPDWVRVVITDQGVGIAPEDLDKIFKLYYTSKPGGSGIGLSVVYRIVQLHDGTVEAKSQPGRGTALVVRLPVRG